MAGCDVSELGFDSACVFGISRSHNKRQPLETTAFVIKQ